MQPPLNYQALCSWANLLLAWRKARRGKRGRAAAASFELEGPEALLQLQQELEAHTFQPGTYNSFAIHDPKRRLISAAPFRDRIVHHALCNLLEPALERSFLATSYANRLGKGTHAALGQLGLYARRFPFFLAADVEQFFAAIDHQVLLRLLARHVPDRELLELCAKVIASGEGVLEEEYTMRFFPGDDLFAVNRPRGLPIGNLTSQFWANVYLGPLDHFIKRQLRCKGYLRYVDDFVLFADTKAQLWCWRAEIIGFLETLRLTLHERRCFPQPVGEGIPFLGWLVFPHYRRLKRRKGIAFRRRLRANLAAYEQGQLGWEELMASIRGWVEHARHGATYGLRRKLFEENPIRPRRERTPP